MFFILKLYQWEWKEMGSFFSILKLYQREWNRIKIKFTIPKFLQVIDPYQIMSLVFKSETEMGCVFPQSNFINENETEMWSIFPYLNYINENGKRCDLFFPYLNFIDESGTESKFLLPYILKYIAKTQTPQQLQNNPYNSHAILHWLNTLSIFQMHDLCTFCNYQTVNKRCYFHQLQLHEENSNVKKTPINSSI